MAGQVWSEMPLVPFSHIHDCEVAVEFLSCHAIVGILLEMLHLRSVATHLSGDSGYLDF